MPTDYGNTDSRDEFLFTLGELSGFIESQSFNNLLIVGDFNVDFDRGGANAQLLSTFMDDLHITPVDLSFQQSVEFTYEKDGGSCTSWVDHILSDDMSSFQFSNIRRVDFGTNLSDHHPLSFRIELECSVTDPLPLCVLTISVEHGTVPLQPILLISVVRSRAVSHICRRRCSVVVM